MGNAIDLTGKKFGRLTVIERVSHKSPHAYWLCECDCGSKLILVRGTYLRKGNIKSCGCLHKDHAKELGLNNRKYSNCTICGSDKHYAKGMCKNCYEVDRRNKIKYMNERIS